MSCLALRSQPSDLLIPGQISDLCSCINIVRPQISVPVLTLLISDLCSCINIVALLSRSSSGDKQSLVSHLECGVTGEVTGDWLVFLFEVTNLMNPHNYQMHSNELWRAGLAAARDPSTSDLLREKFVIWGSGGSYQAAQLQVEVLEHFLNIMTLYDL